MIINANSLDAFPLADGSVHMCVTSPPYWGLRDYGVAGQLGLEATPDEFVAHMVQVFREVWRVLRDDGTCWLNLGDSYNTNSGGNWGMQHRDGRAYTNSATKPYEGMKTDTLKPKDLCGIPWAVAKALQAPFYTGRISAERDRVWLAAIIDAEGTICGFTHDRKDGTGTRTGVHVNITNSNRRLLDEAHRIWPASLSDHNQAGPGHIGKMDTWRWIAHNVDDKALLMRELYPYLIAKQKQALLAYNLFEMSKNAKRLGKSSEKEAVHAKRALIVDYLSRLNHLEDVDVPDWCVEPPALFAPGWYLRSAPPWLKRNAMPESVGDRPTTSHEYLFLLSKQPRYFFDADAIKPKSTGQNGAAADFKRNTKDHLIPGQSAVQHREEREPTGDTGARNRRTSDWWFDSLDLAIADAEAWLEHAKHVRDNGGLLLSEDGEPLGLAVNPHPYKMAHFATFPPALVEPCILAGTSAAGCCSVCGAPWARCVERDNDSRTFPGQGLGWDERKANGKGGSGGHVNATTTGWSPTCAHDAPTVPAIVLDCFAGSGTTGAVARLHGRRFVGLDLNATYLRELALPRAEGKTSAAALAELPLFQVAP